MRFKFGTFPNCLNLQLESNDNLITNNVNQVQKIKFSVNIAVQKIRQYMYKY